jgi:hypothetical protein
MLVSEMIRRLREALLDEEQPYTHSSARIMSWLQGAYMDRLLRSDYWNFLHAQGVFITTVADTANYSIPVVKDIISNSLYYIKTGTVARIPIDIKDYAVWAMEEASGIDTAPSAPSYLIELPDFTWTVDPIPDDVYTIYADRWLRPVEFADATAEPLWEAEFHEIVVLEAMKIAVALKPDSPESAIMAQMVRERLPRMERTFNRRYLPSIGSARAHL